MACKTSCKLCKRLVISTSVTFDGTEVVVQIPDGQYYDGEKYCIVIAQAIPPEATINAPVVIGTTTNTYPLTGCDCQPVTVCSIRTRTRYSTRVVTGATIELGTFRLLGKVNGGCPAENVPYIGG